MKTSSKNYSEVQVLTEPTIKTGNEILDAFISRDNGFVVGSSIFLTGTSGAGKTTLAFILQKTFENYRSSLYSREMSAVAVKHQLKRYSLEHNNAFIADKDMCPNMDAYINELEVLKPSLVIVDSLQVIAKEDYKDISEEAAAFEIIQKLRVWTEKNNAVLIIVGHVNKDGGFEGKNTIEHMFDAHLEMIYDKKRGTRTLSWAKNRKGIVGEVLYYEFGEETIEFYTESQYEIKKEKMSMVAFLNKSFEEYFKVIKAEHKNSPYYKEFTTEFRGMLATIGDMEYVNAFARVMVETDRLMKKHNLA